MFPCRVPLSSKVNGQGLGGCQGSDKPPKPKLQLAEYVYFVLGCQSKRFRWELELYILGKLALLYVRLPESNTV